MPVKKVNNFNNKKSGAGRDGLRLYLRVHVMPKLNMPLRGKPWQWIIPMVALAFLIFAAFYFLAE